MVENQAQFLQIPKSWLHQSNAGDHRCTEVPRGTHPTFVLHSGHESQGKGMSTSVMQAADTFSTLGRHSSPCSHYTLLFQSSFTGILQAVQKSTAHHQPALISQQMCMNSLPQFRRIMEKTFSTEELETGINWYIWAARNQEALKEQNLPISPD